MKQERFIPFLFLCFYEIKNLIEVDTSVLFCSAYLIIESIELAFFEE